MKRAFSTLATVLCVAALAIVFAAIAVPALLGLQRYVITGGSMTGTIDKGSVVYSKLTPTEELKVGDIITFQPPGFTTLVTHRIISIDRGQDGRRVFSTKGDFNSAADPWSINLVQPQQARCMFYIPYIGYFLAALAVRGVRMILIGLPALTIAFSLLWGLWTAAGEELAQRGAEAGQRSAGSRA